MLIFNCICLICPFTNYERSKTLQNIIIFLPFLANLYNHNSNSITSLQQLIQLLPALFLDPAIMYLLLSISERQAMFYSSTWIGRFARRNLIGPPEGELSRFLEVKCCINAIS